MSELGDESQSDSLARWMSHYIADLITSAESVPLPERSSKMEECCKAILQLWSHRASLVCGGRPFRDLNVFMRAIEDLHPDRETIRYFQSIWVHIERADENTETRKLLDFIYTIDQATRIIIAQTLAEAAEASADKAREWVRLAKEAGAEAATEDAVLSFISETSISNDDSNDRTAELKKQRILARVKKLEAFIEVAAMTASAMKASIPNFNSEGP